ncbi:MAG: glycosyltransferase family 39 protein [Candidatus Hydrogenedentota bacterium]
MEPAFFAIAVLTVGAVAGRRRLALLTGPLFPVAVCVAAAWGLVTLPVLAVPNMAYLVALYPFVVTGLWVALMGYVIHEHFAAWFNPAMLSVIAVGALVLRMKGLTHTSLWNDELLSVTQCDPGNSLSVMLDQTLTRNGIPPLYFFLLWGWFQVVGLTEFTARFPSVLIGVACVPAMYLLGRRLARPGAGLIAALLIALNWVHLEQSQDARPYGLLILMTVVAWLAFLRYLETPSRKHTAYWALAAVLLVYTHLFGWLVLMAQAVVLPVFAVEARGERCRRSWWRAVGVAAFTVICFMPYVPRMLASFNSPQFWPPKPTPLFFVDYFRTFFHDPGLALLCAALIGALLVYAYTREGGYLAPGRLHRVLFLLAVWLVVGSFVPVIHSYNTPTSVMVFRYFLILLPALLLLVALAIDAVQYIPARALLLALAGLLSALDIFAAGNYYERPSIQEYRHLAEAVPAREDALYFAKEKQAFKFAFYLEQHNAGIAVHEAVPEVLREVLVRHLDEADLTIWILENVQFYGVIEDPVFLAFVDRFLVHERTIERRLVRARAYHLDPKRRNDLRALLRKKTAQWPAVLTGGEAAQP